MVDTVRKTVAFLATYCEELVQLQKPTLEPLQSCQAGQGVERNKKLLVPPGAYIGGREARAIGRLGICSL